MPVAALKLIDFETRITLRKRASRANRLTVIEVGLDLRSASALDNATTVRFVDH